MTKLLAIETTGSVCGVSVMIDGSLRSASEILQANVHDEMLAGCVKYCLHTAGMDASQLTVVALSSGPGSFTGLRIGAAFAKGLCFESDCKLLAVPTMTSLYYAGLEVAEIAGCTQISGVIASHRDLFYVQNMPLGTTPWSTLPKLLERSSIGQYDATSTLVVGPAAGEFTSKPISGLHRLSPRFVSHAAWHMLKSGAAFSDPLTFEPLYGQDFEPRV